MVQPSWQVTEVEHRFEIPVGNNIVSAKIDRIDRHVESGEIRIIDYKTGGKAGSTSSAHRTRQNTNSKLPEHIRKEDPPLHSRDDGKKQTTYLWKDLQLPLYVSAIQRRDHVLATPCYFKLGETRGDTGIHPWNEFDEEDLDAAMACAEWIAERISDQHFRPITQKVTYDDYDLLWCTRSSDEVIADADL